MNISNYLFILQINIDILNVRLENIVYFKYMIVAQMTCVTMSNRTERLHETNTDANERTRFILFVELKIHFSSNKFQKKLDHFFVSSENYFLNI